jgi:hypothetical protein
MARVRCVGVSKMRAPLRYDHDALFPFHKILWISWTSCHFSSLSHKNWPGRSSMAVFRKEVLD